MKLTSILLSTIIIMVIFESCSKSNQIARNLANTYYGFLPCADCPGISYTLNLKKNAQYTLNRFYSDHITSISSEGKYTFTNGRLNLYENDKITERYDQEGDNLIFLDTNGHRIDSSLSPYYTLYKGDPTKAKMEDR